jgi:hypothetical protein
VHWHPILLFLMYRDHKRVLVGMVMGLAPPPGRPRKHRNSRTRWPVYKLLMDWPPYSDFINIQWNKLIGNYFFNAANETLQWNRVAQKACGIGGLGTVVLATERAIDFPSLLSLNASVMQKVDSYDPRHVTCTFFTKVSNSRSDKVAFCCLKHGSYQN